MMVLAEQLSQLAKRQRWPKKGRRKNE